MVLSHNGCNAHPKPGPLVAFRFSCWSLEIRYDKMSFYEAYQTWIFLSQVFGWYLKLPNCVMSKSSHLFSQSSSHPGWQIDWEVSLIRLGGDCLMWRPFVWDATKTIGIWPWKTMTLPKRTWEFLGTAQTAKSRYQHLEQTSTWMTQKRFSLTSNALNHQFFWNPWVESKLFHF